MLRTSNDGHIDDALTMFLHFVLTEIVKDSINTCPRTSLGGYFIVLAYIFQCKLVYNTLIFAICRSATFLFLYHFNALW